MSHTFCSLLCLSLILELLALDSLVTNEDCSLETHDLPAWLHQQEMVSLCVCAANCATATKSLVLLLFASLARAYLKMPGFVQFVQCTNSTKVSRGVASWARRQLVFYSAVVFRRSLRLNSHHWFVSSSPIRFGYESGVHKVAPVRSSAPFGLHKGSIRAFFFYTQWSVKPLWRK